MFIAHCCFAAKRIQISFLTPSSRNITNQTDVIWSSFLTRPNMLVASVWLNYFSNESLVERSWVFFFAELGMRLCAVSDETWSSFRAHKNSLYGAKLWLWKSKLIFERSSIYWIFRITLFNLTESVEEKKNKA